ncbi:MAG TPA: DUF4194 domain-containing protein [Polyangiales bacterium]|nr:DUF4194 domain-containing protein [Polyangiales bacterium]
MSKPADAFSTVVINLMKGVTYVEADPPLWQSLLELQARVREHVAVLGLELVLDPAEGYAYLRQRAAADDEAELPRLVPRRQLSFPVSLILALLRKKLAEFDAASGDTRLIMTGDEIADLVKLFLADGSNEARQRDRIDQHLQRLVDLGFLQKLRGRDDAFEVRRILKAFVDAQWLGDLSQRLGDYRTHGTRDQEETP